VSVPATSSFAQEECHEESPDSGWENNLVVDKEGQLLQCSITAVANKANIDKSACMLCKTRPSTVMLKVWQKIGSSI
jgi:hypothetical protein